MRSSALMDCLRVCEGHGEHEKSGQRTRKSLSDKTRRGTQRQASAKHETLEEGREHIVSLRPENDAASSRSP